MGRINQAVKDALAHPVDWGFGESKEKKTQFFWVNFQFDEIVDDNDMPLTIQKDFYLTDKTFEYVLRDLQTLGWVGKSIFELVKDQEESFDLSKSQCRLTVEMESYTGSSGKTKMYPRVKYINSVNYTGYKIDEVKKLSAKLKAKIAVYRDKNKSTTKNEVFETETDKDPY